jgi:hypothetical protein
VAMRGRPDRPQSFWYSIDVEDLVETDHPLRAIKRMVDEANGHSERTSALRLLKHVRKRHGIEADTLVAEKASTRRHSWRNFAISGCGRTWRCVRRPSRARRGRWCGGCHAIVRTR